MAQSLKIFLWGNRFQLGFLRQIIVYSLLLILAALFLLPFYWMLNTALKPSNQVFNLPPVWFPNPIQWGNFYEALSASAASESSPSLYSYAWNSPVITLNGVIGILLSSALVA